MLIPRNSKVLFTYAVLILLNVFLMYYSTSIFGGNANSSSVRSEESIVQDNYRVRTDEVKDKKQTAASKKVNILLFTSFRSGSSYVGHLFASNPNIFYMFEPLSVYNPEIDEGIKSGIINSSRQHGYKCINESVTCRLEYLFKCQLLQFFDEAFYRNPGKEETITGWYGRIFAEMQRNLNINAKNVALDNFCNDMYDIVVAKIIRVKYLRDVVPLMKNGLKVIYLIRDPRGVLNSRRTLFKMQDPVFRKNTDVECEKYGANIDFLTTEVSKDPDLLQLFEKNFIFVRYEDISQDLYGYAQKIYKFVGLEMPHEVEVFAKSNAKVNLWSKPNTMQERPGFLESKELIPWRTSLPFEKVDDVQKVCEKQLQHLGYKTIKHEGDLKNISYPVIGEVDKSFPCYVGL